MIKNKKVSLLIGIIGVLSILTGVTFAFFNYTRVGQANTIRVGRISFNHQQTNTIALTNVFPIDSDSVSSDTNNTGTVTITITGDTTYDDGIEYLLTVINLNNKISNKEIPISVLVSGTNIGNNDDSYFDNRGGNTSIHKVLAEGIIKDNKELLVGYITKGSTGVNGTINVKAYIDKDNIAISDTYNGEETDNMGTTNNWVDNRTVFTTEEWNSFQSTAISFQVKVEANEGIWVEEPLTGEQMVRRAITAKINAETNACNPIWVDDMGTANDDTDDITYFSGDNTCVDMNYVWYSGKLWRITAIYPDGAMKLVTENNITSIAFNESEQVNFWTDANTTSYMYQWLNEDFYDTLYNASEFIDTTKKWNATMPANTTISTKPAETNMVTANVGLLNSYEYYNSYRCVGSSACTGSTYGTGYLNIGYYWWLLNPYSTSYVWNVYSNGRGTNNPSLTNGGRPSIYLKSGLEFTGSGTKGSPYKIIGDKDTGSANDLINTRLSGEYVKLVNNDSNQMFRIIGVEDNKTKIIAMDYADNKGTRKFATSTGTANTLWGSGTTTDTDTWYEYLNRVDNSDISNTGYYDKLVKTYGELFDSGIYYLGTSGYNYKLSVCANTTSGKTSVCDKTSQNGTFNIGLPRYGEMFAAQQAGGDSNSINIWLMNRYSASDVWFVYYRGYDTYNYPTNTNGGRPTLHLKSTVKILSGSGTESDPYVVGL